MIIPARNDQQSKTLDGRKPCSKNLAMSRPRQHFNWSNYTLPQLGIAVACSLASLSLVLPWVDVGSYRGMGYQSQEGPLLLLFFVYPLLTVIFNGRLLRSLGVLCGLIPGVWMVWIVVEFWAVSKWGMFVFLAGCALLASMATIYRKAPT
jgi:hypothetical protein